LVSNIKGITYTEMFENRILRRIHVFGFKRDQVIGDWRKMHNEDFLNFYSSSKIKLWRTKSSGRVARIRGREEKCIQSFVGMSEGKRPLGGPRCMWEGNIKTNLREIVCGGKDWIHLAQDRDQ
jgi:hypothetical protein